MECEFCKGTGIVCVMLREDDSEQDVCPICNGTGEREDE